MKVFITGATGYLGSAIASTLSRSGHRVRGLARDQGKAVELRRHGVSPVIGDFSEPTILSSAASEADVLIHAGLAHGPDASRWDRLAVQSLLAGACQGRARLFIYTSGTWMLGPSAGPSLDEDAIPHAPRVVEWRPSVERDVLGANGGRLSTVVIRPGCVYGGRRGLFGRIIHYLFEERRIRLIEGGRNRWATVYLDDLAELYRLMVDTQAAPGIYHATDGSADTVRTIARTLIEEAGGGSIEDWPLIAAREELGPIADALAMDQHISSDKARRMLGWKPQVVSAAAHARCLLEEWHEARAGLSLV